MAHAPVSILTSVPFIDAWLALEQRVGSGHEQHRCYVDITILDGQVERKDAEVVEIRINVAHLERELNLVDVALLDVVEELQAHGSRHWSGGGRAPSARGLTAEE